MCVLYVLSLAYDNAVRKQKLHTEVLQARREVDHYLQAVDRKKVKEAVLKRKRKAGTLKEEEEVMCDISQMIITVLWTTG